MNPDEARRLLAELLHGIAPEADIDTIAGSAQIQEELDLDSMDFLNLMTALHDTTGIDVPERDYPRLSTVDGFATYVSAAAAAPTGAGPS